MGSSHCECVEGGEGRGKDRMEGGKGRGRRRERMVVCVQSPPQIKAQLPSNATACYALAVSADGKVRDVTSTVCYANT